MAAKLCLFFLCLHKYEPLVSLQFPQGKVAQDTPLAFVSPGGGPAQLETISFGFGEPGIDLLIAIYGGLCSERAQYIRPDRNPVALYNYLRISFELAVYSAPLRNDM